MPTTTPTSTNAACASESRASMPGGGATGDGQIRVGRAELLRALFAALFVIALLGVGLTPLLFAAAPADAAAASLVLPESARPYYLIGLAAAGFAAVFTIWVHGRFAAARAPIGQGMGGQGMNGQGAGALVAGRLQSLLAAAFGVKLFVLVVGVLALKRFPIGAEPPKFLETATFAVSFAGAALLCQLVTALLLARALTRRAPTSALSS